MTQATPIQFKDTASRSRSGSFFWFLRNGWCAVPLYLIVLLMSGCVDDLVAVQNMAGGLKDSTARCHRGDIESAD